jgi:glucokinase
MNSALIGDIGATNARFGLLIDGKQSHVSVLEVAAYPSLGDAILAYFDGLKSGGAARPRRGALAVAGPVTGDFLSFTNHPWSFSISALTRALELERLEIVNDFVALAMAVPHLTDRDRRQIGPGEPVAGTPVGVIGPGTGLGVSIVVPDGRGPKPRWIPIASEGGHVTLPAVTEREAAVVNLLHRDGRAHVSAETLICGQGLSTLYDLLSALDGAPPATLQPAEVTTRALAGGDKRAIETVGLFCAMLGTVAGNLALTAGARGGVYIAGGIVPRFGDVFDRSEFRERFVAKGRMRRYLEPIPTYLVTEDLPAFRGLTALLEQG